jgi:DNA polymerase family A
MTMRAFVLDYECYYDRASKYTLEHMNPAEYILDDRFEVTGLAVKELGCPAQWIEGPDVGAFFASLDPDATTTLSHNALFDASISSYRYGFVPKLIVCTLGIARAVLNLESYSLKSVAEHLGLPAKGEEIHQADGMRLADLKANPDFYRKYIDYALKDDTICEGIYNKLVVTGRFPPEEIRVQDLVLRCAVQPVLHANVPMLKEHLADLREHKQQLLNDAGYDKAALMSAAQFKAALEGLGVEVKYKPSPANPNREMPAFAKTDPFMTELTEYQAACDDTNLKVQTLANARLAHKSTIEETRSERFLSIASLPWPNGGPMLPMPLRYGGAKTHRLSGDWKMNVQNLVRDTTKSKLRTSATAPDGYKLVTADSSQIEARLVAQLCGQEDLLEAFRNGVDVYASFASNVFGQPVTKKEQPGMRFIGKTGILGLGYKCGAKRFHQMVVTQARQYGIPLDGLFDERVAGSIVRTYRRLYKRIPRMWRHLDNLLRFVLMSDRPHEEPLDPVIFMSGRIRLPNGLFLRYGDVGCEDLYGGKLLENICQALARVIIMQAALRLARRGYRFILQAHDELIFCIPDDQLEDARAAILQEMTQPPAWCEELPLAVEIKQGLTYGNCEIWEPING